MYARLDQVGESVKCPDCGAQTIVPPPRPVKPQKQPAALAAEDQYEVWGVDEAPSLADMVAAQPAYIALQCRLCQTLMHATEDQVGKTLKCPDCGAANVVPPSPATTQIPAARTRTDDLELHAAPEPFERPKPLIPPRRPMLYEEEQEAARARQAEKDARGDRRGPNFDDAGRPVLPRWPLATRVLPFLFSSGVPVRWALLSLGALMCGGFMLSGIGFAAQGDFGAIAGMAFLAVGAIVLAIWLAALAAIVIAIVVESSEGSDEVQSWPESSFSEWFGPLLYLLIACLVSPLPGWLFGLPLGDDSASRVWLFLGSVVVCLPVVILSQLDVGSAFAVASPRIVASVFRLPGTWLMFYAEIALLVAVCAGVTMGFDAVAPQLGLLDVALYVAAMLLAARILGRLGWTLAEATPAPDQEKYRTAF